MRPVTREEASDMADAHSEGLHDELKREFCPDCEGRSLAEYRPAAKFAAGDLVKAANGRKYTITGLAWFGARWEYRCKHRDGEELWIGGPVLSLREAP